MRRQADAAAQYIDRANYYNVLPPATAFNATGRASRTSFGESCSPESPFVYLAFLGFLSGRPPSQPPLERRGPLFCGALFFFHPHPIPLLPFDPATQSQAYPDVSALASPSNGYCVFARGSALKVA